MSDSTNTFTELNTDFHPINSKPNVMTDAVNATLTTKGGNQLILQNMSGNSDVTELSEGFQPLGMAVYKGISYIVSGRFDEDGNFIEGEIGSYPSPDWGVLLSTGQSDEYLPLKDEYAPLYNFSKLPASDPKLNDDNFL